MVRRVRSDDLELMATAISIQHQVGGNLAEILDSIAYTIRERVRIKGEIRTLTAQQRMSGYVVGRPADRPGRRSCSSPLRASWTRCSRTRRRSSGCRPASSSCCFGGFMMFIGLHAHPPHRRHRGLERCPSSPILIAAVAAGRHPADRRRPRRQRAGRPGPGPPDPARHDAGQEPRGARAPAAVPRADAAPAGRSACRARMSPHARARRSATRPRNGWRSPATPATCASRTGWASRRSAPIVGAVLFFLLFVILGLLKFPLIMRLR